MIHIMVPKPCIVLAIGVGTSMVPTFFGISQEQGRVKSNVLFGLMVDVSINPSVCR